MTLAACGGTGSSVKRSENWSNPIPSIGLGRHTTTTTISSVLLMCGGRVCSILLLHLVARCLETIDVCIWCSVGVSGNVYV